MSTPIERDDLSADERTVIAVLESSAAPYVVETIERGSDREFDLELRGIDDGMRYRAWMPLAVIGRADWTALAEYTDYPSMVAAGDWSGIRDSSELAIWRMFDAVRGS